MASNASRNSEQLIDLTDPEVCANFIMEDSHLDLLQHDQCASQDSKIKLEDSLDGSVPLPSTTNDSSGDKQDNLKSSPSATIRNADKPIMPSADEDHYYSYRARNLTVDEGEDELTQADVNSEDEDFEEHEDNDAEHVLDGLDEQSADYELTDDESDDSSADEVESKPSKKRHRKAETGSQANKRTKYGKAKDTGLFHRRPGVDEDDELPLEAGLGDLLQNYMNGDVFADISNSKGRDRQPTFDATHRVKAMQQMRKELSKASRKELKQLNKDILDVGNRRIRPTSDGLFNINGMVCNLEHYQVAGVVKMRRREQQKEQPRGGLLADQMGLGKTVMMLANMVLSKAEDKSQGPTLLVVPSALLPQWNDEIGKHINEGVFGTVYRWYAGKKGARIPDRRLAKTLFGEVAIILTTYGEISRSYPKRPEFPDDLPVQERQAWWKKYVADNAGVFHQPQMKFFRVVLDEAQEIKNHRSHRSAACRALKATHTWPMSGTPIQNTLDEFFSYFKLLRVKETGTIKEFRHNYSNVDDPKAMARLVSQISKWTIRRTHADQYLGAKLLTLPKPSKQSISLPMSPLERDIYNIVEKRFLERITGIANSDNDNNALTKRQYKLVLVLTLRLRQLTVHPLLIQDCIRDLLTEEDFEKLHEVLDMPRPYHESDPAVIRHLRFMLQNKDHLDSLESVGDSASEPSASQTPPAFASTGGAYGVNNSFRDYLGAMKQEQAQDRKARDGCPCCQKPPTQPMLTSCNHVYCFGCVTKLSYEAQQAGRTSSCCLICGQDIRALRDYGEIPNQPSSQDSPTDKDYKKFRSSRREALRLAIKKWVDVDGNVVHSTKTQAIKAQVLQWLEEDPDGKIIIYSQFRTVLEILRRICEMETWECRMYHGQMNSDQKEKTLQAFRTVPNIKILLASLKTGGVGLNIVEASHVIIVEPWWNIAAEDQAFCRTYRRGQTKVTDLRRCIMLNTIDETLVKMQEQKSAEISKALNPDALSSFSKVELMSLFSTHKTAGHGNTYLPPRAQASEDIDAPLPGDGMEGEDDYLAVDDTARGFMGGR